MRLLALFFATVAFLTRVPVPLSWQGSDERTFSRVPYGFLWVGLLLGAFCGLVGLGAQLYLPAGLVAVLVVGVQLLLTGCMHEDGLADVADSMGAWEREKRFAIMRDSSLGVYGVSALLSVLLWRVLCIYYLLEFNALYLVCILILAMGGGRWVAAMLMSQLPYLKDRAGGVGIAAHMARPSPVFLLAAFVLVAILAIAILPYVGGLFAIVMLVSVGVFRAYFQRVFEGVTGDCLGAAIVLTECLMLTAGVALWASLV